MIRYNVPITLQFCRRRKRSEVTPDFKRQLRDKKNKLQDRARLRKAQSLVSLITEHSSRNQEITLILNPICEIEFVG